ncbi:MAG: type II CAAX endopeptidase family protein, partial [Dehalococcoidia bacterium]
VLVLNGDPEVETGFAIGLALATLGFSLWIGGVVLILARRRGMSMADLGFRPMEGTAWLWPVATWFGGVMLVAAYSLVIFVVEELTGRDLSRLVEGNPLPETEATTALVWAVLGVAVILAAPFGEELFFRAFLFRAVQARWGLIAGLVASGGAFAVVHFEVSVFLPFWGIGMLFAWAYHRSGSLWTPVIAHAIFNSVSFAATIAGVNS